jgi:hypothetical protein
VQHSHSLLLCIACVTTRFTTAAASHRRRAFAQDLALIITLHY